jgi:hypothetical protein
MKNLVLAISLAAILSVSAGAQEHRQVIRMGVSGEHGSGIHQARAVGDHQIEMMGPAMFISGGVVKGAPYSAEGVTEMVQKLADGNAIRRENSTKLYRDNEGRTRREDQIGGIGPWATGGAKSVIFIHDPVEGVQYILHPDSKTAEKISMPHLKGEHGTAIKADGPRVLHRSVRIVKRTSDGDGEHSTSFEESEISNEANWTKDISAIATLHAPGQDASGGTEESLGSRLIAGVEANGTRGTITIPAGTIGNEQPIEIVSERWYSEELQLELMTKRSDPRSGETTYELRNLQRVEPLPSLFEVPADYTINERNVFMRRKE